MRLYPGAEDNVVDRPRPSTLRFPVVGIGASAGGLAAAVRSPSRLRCGQRTWRFL